MKMSALLQAVRLCVVPLVLAVLLHAPLARADGNPPPYLTYQGYLTDANGNPLGSTNAGPKNYDVVFRVWDSATGGNKLYAEQQTVTVNAGYFSVLLGLGSVYLSEPHPSIASLFSGPTASSRFVEFTIKGIGVGATDVTVQPRLQLLTTPYSFLALNADTASSATTAGFLVNSANTTIVTVTNSSVGINMANPISTLDVNGTVTATGLNLRGNPAQVGAVSATSLMVTNGVTAVTLSASGLVTAGSLTVNGAESDGSLAVNGAATAGSLTVNGAATVHGLATLTGGATSGGAITAPTFVGNGTIPIGGIIIWSGTAAAVPAGWLLCDGNNGTPDLRNRFVIGAGSSYAPGIYGGSATVLLSSNNIPPHSHQYVYVVKTSSTSVQGIGGQNGTYAGYNYAVTNQTAEAGGGQSFSVLNPYYALCYIKRVQ